MTKTIKSILTAAVFSGVFAIAPVAGAASPTDADWTGATPAVVVPDHAEAEAGSRGEAMSTGALSSWEGVPDHAEAQARGADLSGVAGGAGPSDDIPDHAEAEAH